MKLVIMTAFKKDRLFGISENKKTKIKEKKFKIIV